MWPITCPSPRATTAAAPALMTVATPGRLLSRRASRRSATWASQSGQGFDEALARVVALIERADGHAFVFDVTPTDAQLEELFSAEREAEWVEFLAECDKAEAELAHEIAIAKFTLAEL